MSAHVNYEYIVCSPLPVITRPAPIAEKREDYCFFANREEIDVNHVFDSIIITTADVTPPKGYARISCSVLGQLEKTVGHNILPFDVVVYAWVNERLTSQYRALFHTTDLPYVRINKIKEGPLVVSVNGGMSDYTVGVFNDKQKEVFQSRIEKGLIDLIAKNKFIRTKQNEHCVLFGLTYQPERAEVV